MKGIVQAGGSGTRLHPALCLRDGRAAAIARARAPFRRDGGQGTHPEGLLAGGDR